MSAPAINEIRRRLAAFARQWQGAARENADAKLFWARFYECYGIRPESATIYEKAVDKLGGGRGFIDSFIPGLLIVEHKSRGKSLEAAFDQAADYFIALPEAERPRYIVTCDFADFRLIDLKDGTQAQCTLADLPRHAEWFSFLVEKEPPSIAEESPIDRQAAYAVSRLHEALLRANFRGRDLEIFLTRLLFCFFADDTGIFGANGVFHRLIQHTRDDGNDTGARLAELFGVLDTPDAERPSNLDETLAAFAYINGNLFAGRARIPAFDAAMREQLIACAELDWSGISPAIFGAMFQGVLEAHHPDEARQATRRELGAHYTSERNILRVIDPLFMDDLRAELEKARRNKPRLQALYDRLPDIQCLDPACGCGNFLVIAYRELRRLEGEVIAQLFDMDRKGRGLLDVATLCRVRVNQFHGIEIDQAAAHIARVALWITDHQMNLQAQQRFGTTRPTVPLVDAPHIHCQNALQADWAQILPPGECSYLMSNPPFVGAKYMSSAQREEAHAIFDGIKNGGLLDYVAAWYVKALAYMNTPLTPTLSPQAGRGSNAEPFIPLVGSGSNAEPLTSPVERGNNAEPLSPIMESGSNTEPLAPLVGRGAGVRGTTHRRDPVLEEKLKTYARQLRALSTDAEQRIWQLLRNRHFLDFKFRRQHPVAGYILDFYCADAGLAIELDGGQHGQQTAYDAQRDATLRRHGIRTLRFWNNDVLLNTEAVLTEIADALLPPPPPLTPTLSPQAGRGSNTEPPSPIMGSGSNTEPLSPIMGNGSNTEPLLSIMGSGSNAEPLSPIMGSGGNTEPLAPLVGRGAGVRGTASPTAGSHIRCAFVSTNSITQGEQVASLWPYLLQGGIKIRFAHRTFKWSNEGKGNAAVHCVIIGFGLREPEHCTIFDYASDIKADEGQVIEAKRINPYLVDGPDIVLSNRRAPICNVPGIGIGNKPIDDGNYLFTDDEKTAFLAIEPKAEPFFRRWFGAEEFINGVSRSCLWLGDAKPNELRSMPECMKRIEAVRRFRLASPSAPTQKLAETPTRFHVEFMPTAPYLLVPSVSSERRNFVPIGFLPAKVMASNLVLTIPNATPYHFAILNSTMHNAWMRAVCGRLKSDYRYSASIVYNNFPWPDPTEKQRAAIEAAGQAILDARALYPEATLADLYDPLTMPVELRRAHTATDRAVDAAYPYKSEKSDPARVAFLFDRYGKLTSLLPADKPKRRSSGA